MKIKDLDIEESFGLVVTYEEAVNWVAFGALVEPSIGPKNLYNFSDANLGFDDEYVVSCGRSELAAELLQKQCALGNIRCYGRKAFFEDALEYFDKASNDYETIPKEIFANGILGLSDWEPEDGDVIEDGKEAYLNILVSFDDLKILYPEGKKSVCPKEDAYDIHKSLPIVKPRERRGRKSIYNWEEFLTEVAVRADLDGLPEKQSTLEQEMASWCLENWGKEPSISVIRKRISKIYNHERKIQV